MRRPLPRERAEGAAAWAGGSVNKQSGSPAWGKIASSVCAAKALASGEPLRSSTIFAAAKPEPPESVETTSENHIVCSSLFCKLRQRSCNQPVVIWLIE